MSSTTVHQLVSGFADGDAISHEALALRNICRGLKFASEIYAPEGSIAPGSAAECQGLGDYRQKPSDVVIYHYSIASPATDAFLSSPARKVLVYHNITPAEFYAPFDDAITDQLVRAREGLRTTALKADAVWADSNFNAAELRAAGGTPEAMGNAGVLYGEFRPEELAELMAQVLENGPLRTEILASQKQRVEALLQRPMQEEFLSLLSPLIPTV